MVLSFVQENGVVNEELVYFSERHTLNFEVN